MIMNGMDIYLCARGSLCTTQKDTQKQTETVTQCQTHRHTHVHKNIAIDSVKMKLNIFAIQWVNTC